MWAHTRKKTDDTTNSPDDWINKQIQVSYIQRKREQIKLKKQACAHDDVDEVGDHIYPMKIG